MTKQKHFVNLTNGIEHIEDILSKGHEVNFVRVQSTTLERSNWVKLLRDLDHNLLMYLALGYDCYFYDCGTNRPLSKTCYLGVPLINYLLEKRWLGTEPVAERYSRNGSYTFQEDEYYSHIYNEIFVYNQDKAKVAVKKKIDYYRRYISDNMGKLIPVSVSTDKDGKYQYYSKIVNNLL